LATGLNIGGFSTKQGFSLVDVSVGRRDFSKRVVYLGEGGLLE